MSVARRLILTAVLLSGCNPSTLDGGGTAGGEGGPLDRLERLRFNQLAIQRNLPLFWLSDDDGDGAVDPGEVRSLLFYGTEGRWVDNGRFTRAFHDAYASMLEAEAAPAPDDPRLAAVVEELSRTAPSLVETDLRGLPADHRAFADHMMRVGEAIDALYALQVGAAALRNRVGDDDAASASLFRRNWGPRCRGTTTENNEACSAIVGAPRQPVDVYPTELQAVDDFCEPLEQREDSSVLLSPFTVVREREGALVAVPYSEAYREQMRPIAAELRAAASALTDRAEDPLRAYLRAAAHAFEDNDWNPADEAWAAMNVHNSRWYVRVGPDEVYWDPCSQKAGFHLTFALINQGSLEWQQRLTPLLQEMERSIAELSESYEPRDVSFHLPDFIDIVHNNGDDRDAFGATIGQSLPNWGPVSDQGRGRTVAMTNLYTDSNSRARRRMTAQSLFSEEAMALYTDDPAPGLLSTILHEATHNLGPAHEYRVHGQTDSEAFGGGLASMLEELKAQSGALFYTAMLRERGLIDETRERESYLDDMVWAMGHISLGMTTPSGQRRPYSQLAAVQVGFMMDRGVLTWDADATAANGEDRGAFSVNFEAFPAAARELMTLVMGIKATGNRAEAERIADRFVDGDVVPQATIRERHNRAPRATMVYSVLR